MKPLGTRVLVTGANGFVGKNLIRCLAENGFEVVPWVRKSAGLAGERIVDLNDPVFPERLAAMPHFDAIVHLAAKVGWQESRKEDFFQPNVLATGKLAEWARERKAHFIFASTAIVCGVRTERISSSTEPHPDTDYGQSKWLAEERIRSSGVRHTILRIGGVFGLDGPGHLGVNVAIQNALNGKVPILRGEGREKRNYLYVKDLCEAIRHCLLEKTEGTHLVAGSHVDSIEDMLRDISSLLMNGREPSREERGKGNDQLIETASILPKGRTFKEAIEDIKNDHSHQHAQFH